MATKELKREHTSHHITSQIETKEQRIKRWTWETQGILDARRRGKQSKIELNISLKLKVPSIFFK